MLKSTLIAATIAAGAMIAATSSASAMPMGGQVQNAVESSAASANLIKVGKRGGRRHRHRHFRFHGYWDHYPVYYHGCYWLKKKAYRTGSRYWWKRYKRCKFGYDFY